MTVNCSITAWLDSKEWTNSWRILTILILFWILLYVPPKYLYTCLHFYTMSMVYAAEYQPCHPHTCICVPWWKRRANACCGTPLFELPHQQNFDRATISIFCNEERNIWSFVGPCWIVSDYCSLQHRHHGCCPLWGVADLKDRIFFVRIAYLERKLETEDSRNTGRLEKADSRTPRDPGGCIPLLR